MVSHKIAAKASGETNLIHFLNYLIRYLKLSKIETAFLLSEKEVNSSFVRECEPLLSPKRSYVIKSQAKVQSIYGGRSVRANSSGLIKNKKKKRVFFYLFFFAFAAI